MQTDFETTDHAEQPAKDIDGVPYCRDHHCRMKMSSGGKKNSPTSYLKCPVEGCEQKAQMIKTKRESVVPNNPVTCPRCAGGIVCVRSPKFSTAAYVVVQCPSCAWKSNSMALPQLAAQHFAARQMRRPEPMIGDR